MRGTRILGIGRSARALQRWQTCHRLVPFAHKWRCLFTPAAVPSQHVAFSLYPYKPRNLPTTHELREAHAHMQPPQHKLPIPEILACSAFPPHAISTRPSCAPPPPYTPPPGITPPLPP
jgi:hypothetical protein